MHQNTVNIKQLLWRNRH